MSQISNELVSNMFVRYLFNIIHQIFELMWIYELPPNYKIVSFTL